MNIDVSELLFPKVYYFDFIESIDLSIISIIIPNWTCNDIGYTIFDFSRFNIVESIEIGDNCFESVETFKIEGLNRLKTIKIGNNSFTQVKKYNWNEEWNEYCEEDWDEDWDESNRAANNQSKSFHILNCESLESIEIGEYSFSDFGGEFELKNLPQLQSIQIGSIGSDSSNFSNSSFVIGGIFNDIEYYNK